MRDSTLASLPVCDAYDTTLAACEDTLRVSRETVVRLHRATVAMQAQIEMSRRLLADTRAMLHSERVGRALGVPLRGIASRP